MNELFLPCRRCEKNVAVHVEIQPEKSIHYAKAVCPDCGGLIQWLKKPSNEGIRTKTSRFSLSSLNHEYCEICGRHFGSLGNRETLEIHHKIPVEEEGHDELTNLLVLCTPCHRMCHFLRKYLNHHLKHYYDAYSETES
jgi:5-methylcytosine-specific restriction endonuclease McrA